MQTSPPSAILGPQAASCQLGWLCGYTFAGFYPQSTEEERQHAVQTDAELLVGNPEHRPAFVEDWMGGFQAAQADRAAQQAQTGRCPCCGQAEVPLSDVTVIIGQLGPASQVELVPEPVCFACAELEPMRRFSLSLARPVHAPSASRMVLSLLVSHEPPLEKRRLAVGMRVILIVSLIVSSLSIQWRRQPGADAPLGGSRNPGTLLQFLALSFRVKSSAGVGAVL